jgi:hypothetical protein
MRWEKSIGNELSSLQDPVYWQSNVGEAIEFRVRWNSEVEFRICSGGLKRSEGSIQKAVRRCDCPWIGFMSGQGPVS